MLSSEVCRLYRELPISVLIFKDEALIHINKHLLEMFSIDELLINLDQIKSEVYYSIFEYTYNIVIENDRDLFNHLLDQAQLVYKSQHIQINTHHLHGYTIFVLTLIKPEESPEPIHAIRNPDEELKILDLFTKTHQRRFKFFSMYKGLHIKSDALLTEISDNQLIFKVSKKHLSSYEDNNEYIIIPNQNSEKVVVANAVKIDLSQQLLYLSNLQVMHHSAKDRKTIRVNCLDKSIPVTFNQNQTYTIYDLSLYSLSVVHDNDDEGFNNMSDRTYTLKFVLHYANIESEVTIDATIEKIMPLSDQQKAVFTFSPNEDAYARIKHYINFRQMELLRELKRFVERVEMLSS